MGEQGAEVLRSGDQKALSKPEGPSGGRGFCYGQGRSLEAASSGSPAAHVSWESSWGLQCRHRQTHPQPRSEECRPASQGGVGVGGEGREVVGSKHRPRAETTAPLLPALPLFSGHHLYVPTWKRHQLWPHFPALHWLIQASRSGRRLQTPNGSCEELEGTLSRGPTV